VIKLDSAHNAFPKNFKRLT